eukprot:526792_1
MSIFNIFYKTRVSQLITLTVGAIAINYIAKKAYRKLKNSPPGPIGFPIIGSAIPMVRNRDKFLKEQVKYGELSFFNVGIANICVINSSKLFTQIMCSKHVLKRPPKSKWTKLPTLTVDNNQWKRRRQNLMKSLISELKSSWMNHALPKVLTEFTFKDINKCINENKLFYCRSNMALLAFSSIYYNGIGKTINKNDNSLQICDDILYLTNEWSHLYEQMTAASFFPYLSWMFQCNGLVNKFNSTENKLLNISKILIEKRLNTKQQIKNGKTKQELISFIDTVIEHKYDIYNIENGNGNEYKSDIMVMFMAGMETTQISAEHLLLFCGAYKQIQNEIFNELQSCFIKHNGEIVNNYKLFSLKWINKCHKYRAFINDGLRLANIVALGVPHIVSNNKDTGIDIVLDNKQNIHIPNGTVLFGNFQHISGFTNNELNNNETWAKPYNKLHLSNWLDENNKFKGNEHSSVF